MATNIFYCDFFQLKFSAENNRSDKIYLLLHKKSLMFVKRNKKKITTSIIDLQIVIGRHLL